MPEFLLWIALIGGSQASSQHAQPFKTEALCEAAKTKLVAAFAVRGVSVAGACVEYYPGK